VLLDTAFFIDLADEEKSRQRGPCAAWLRTHRHSTKRVSVITLGEYAVGSSARETIRFFRGYQPVALGTATAKRLRPAGPEPCSPV
jgi:predicted nucleic acid-binding protein